MNRFLLFLLLLSGCAGRSGPDQPDQIMTMQVVDRNGFTETLSGKDRLSLYQEVDFLQPQPYQKVLRVFGRTKEGKSRSKITSYHPNGQISQYLETIDGRAHGTFRQWHDNGALKVEVQVIEGVADLSEIAQASWVFEGVSRAWDDQGHLLAAIPYKKGALEGISTYYHLNGKIEKILPFEKNRLEGDACTYDEEGRLIEKIKYVNGVEEGEALAFWDPPSRLQYREIFSEGKLHRGLYYDLRGNCISHIQEGSGKRAKFDGGKLASLIEYQEGIPRGKVELFRPDGSIASTYCIQNGLKSGEEILYYPQKKGPRLCIHWVDDVIQGTVKSWYENGVMESQRDMNQNKKHGLAFGWYADGELMLLEEYENDLLMKGSYYKKGEKHAASRIDGGKGTATLFTPEGNYVRRINYENGRPIVEE